MRKILKPLLVITAVVTITIAPAVYFDNGWIISVTWIPAIVTGNYLDGKL